MFPELGPVMIGRVMLVGDLVQVEARTRPGVVACPGCGESSGRVHGYHLRHLADVAVGGRAVSIGLRVRRLVCETIGCSRQTFREQVAGVTERYARRTPQLASLIADLAVVLAGRAGVRVLARLAVTVSRTTVLRLLMAVPTAVVEVPAVLSVDDFALLRRHRYASLLIDAVTHRRVDVLPDRKAATLAAWLREHPGVRVVCRDGSASYAEGIRQGAPDAVQVSDRWHLWHGLGKAIERTVTAHSQCWHDGPARQTGAREEITRQRHAAVHVLLADGTGLLECARRLGWALNTVKRYARAGSAQDLLRPPQYRPTLVDPYRDHLRNRLAQGPVPVTHLLAEIGDLGYTGSVNLLVRYLNQGRADPERVPPSPRRLVSWIMTRPADHSEPCRRHLDELTATCPQMTALAARVREFAVILTQRRGPDLDTWIKTVLANDLPALHTFVHGLGKDHAAVIAGLTLPYSNGPIEGTNTKVKLIKRQMYGRAGFALLRQRILLS